jgi:hypothetical protein
MPLGKLSSGQIQTGYTILKKIEQALKTKAQINALRGKRHQERQGEIAGLDKSLVTLTNEFYTVSEINIGLILCS